MKKSDARKKTEKNEKNTKKTTVFFTTLELNQLLFAEDTVVVADFERKLCQLAKEFGRVCERRKFRVNVVKIKVMRCTRN